MVVLQSYVIPNSGGTSNQLEKTDKKLLIISNLETGLVQPPRFPASRQRPIATNINHHLLRAAENTANTASVLANVVSAAMCPPLNCKKLLKLKLCKLLASKIAMNSIVEINRIINPSPILEKP